MDKKHELRIKRHARVRRKVAGTAERPRLAVFRSLHHIYAQVIDDSQGKTLAAASTVEPDLRKSLKSGGNIDAAKAIGKLIGERARERGVEKVVFDRGGFMYHGRVQGLAEAAREAGLQF
jgi:large subunit ribosomal protein L18